MSNVRCIPGDEGHRKYLRFTFDNARRGRVLLLLLFCVLDEDELTDEARFEEGKAGL